jgi:hypothetical protein
MQDLRPHIDLYKEDFIGKLSIDGIGRDLNVFDAEFLSGKRPGIQAGLPQSGGMYLIYHYI